MGKPCYTYRIEIAHRNRVKVTLHDPEGNLLGEPDGNFGYMGEIQSRILYLQRGQNGPSEGDIKEMGETLFEVLFDEGLRRDFFNLYSQALSKSALLRVELDVDEQELPDVAALPWEFMRVPSGARYGEFWLATAPDLIFSRRRARWKAPDPIVLDSEERLRVALAASAPSDVGPVLYEKLWEELKNLAAKKDTQFELLELVYPATPFNIDAVLEKKPHIFHFIGHARFRDEQGKEGGQIALVDDSPGWALWIGADRFSELFTRHQPGVVVLQACEGAVLSASEAFVGVASKIVDQNIPVVVAMQYEISNTLARQFTLAFYRRLSEDEPVDKAAQEARRHIALGPTQYNTRDFATPVIFNRAPNGRPFRRKVSRTAPEAPSTQPARLQGRSVGEGIIALIELMQSPEVRECVIRFQADFRAAREQIDVLDYNKRVHDLLHTVQFQIYNYIVQQAKRRLLDEDDWEILMSYELTFRRILDDLKDIGDRGAVLLGEVSWIQNLVMAGEELKKAVDNLDVGSLKEAARLIKRVLFLQPSVINARLIGAARALRLPDLLNAMEAVRTKITRPDVDQKKVRQFEIGIDDLAKLSQTLDHLIKEHDKWQGVDNDLRRIEAMLIQDMGELECSWPRLRENVESLCVGKSEPWALSLKEEGDKLHVHIDSQESAKVKQNFRRYRRLASDRFYQVDLSLRNLCCNDLRNVGDPLSSVLRIIGE